MRVDFHGPENERYPRRQTEGVKRTPLRSFALIESQRSANMIGNFARWIPYPLRHESLARQVNRGASATVSWRFSTAAGVRLPHLSQA